MPTPKLLRYALRNAAGHYYYVSNGSVLTSVSARYLEYSPVDWERTEFQMGRDGKHLGVFRKAILPITFAKDGARIIRHIAFVLGIDSYCKYEIYKRDTLNYNYTLESEGEIDFSEIVAEDHKVGVKAIENGLAQLIETSGDKMVEVLIQDSDPQFKTIVMDGFPLQGKYEWIMPETLQADGSLEAHNLGSTTGTASLMDVFYFNNETFLDLGDGLSQDSAASIGDIFFDSIYNATATFSILGKIGINNNNVGAAVRFKINLVKYNSSYGSPVTYTLYNDTTDSIGNNGITGFTEIEISGSASIPIVYGDKVRAYIELVVISGTVSNVIRWRNTEDGSVTMTSTFLMPETTTRGVKFLHLFQKVITSLSNGSYSGASSYLSNIAMADYSLKPNHLYVTSGEELRGVWPSKIKTTLNDLLQTAKSVMGLQLCIEGAVAKLEKPSYCMNDSVTIFTASNVNNFKVSVASEYRYSLINVGYPDQDYDEINGRQEVNSEQQWTTGIKNSSNTLDLVSRYRADPYGMEYVRSRQFIGLNSSRSNRYATENTDDSADNDIFMMHCNPTPAYIISSVEYFNLYRGWVAVSGFVVANQGIYNLTLTPHRNLCRNLQFIKSGLTNSTTSIQFVSGKKNTGVTVTDLEVIDEDSNQTLTGITRIFQPYYLTFDAPRPIGLMNTMNTSTKYGKIVGTDARGNTFSGPPIDISVNPGTNTAKTIKLLASPTMDMTKQSFNA